MDMDKIEERLFALAQLKRKLRRNLPEILSLREEIAENLSFLDVCGLDLSRLAKEESELAGKLAAVTAQITPLRRESAAAFAQDLENELRGLGFSEQVRVIPDFVAQEIWPGINDEKVRILWAPNPGQPPQPLDRIASGGELSRFLLALTSVRPGAESATYIFDEVDAGVGGLTLNKLAEKLYALAENRQMLLITHWPQLAARAQKHFQISKIIKEAATFTLCTPLDGQARHAELARMAGGGARERRWPNLSRVEVVFLLKCLCLPRLFFKAIFAHAGAAAGCMRPIPSRCATPSILRLFRQRSSNPISDAESLKLF